MGIIRHKLINYVQIFKNKTFKIEELRGNPVDLFHLKFMITKSKHLFFLKNIFPDKISQGEKIIYPIHPYIRPEQNFINYFLPIFTLI